MRQALATLLGENRGPLPASERELQAIQAQFKQWLGQLVGEGKVILGHEAVTLGWSDEQGAYGLGSNVPAESGVSRAASRWCLALLAARHPLAACPARKPRGEPGQVCGRWYFMRRPKQRYCSLTCYDREKIRKARRQARRRSR